MIRPLHRLVTDRRGATLVEFAIALPVLITFIYGIFVVGMLHQSNAGLQHALGEAARYTTLYPTPTDEQIESMIMSRNFGLQGGTLETPAIATDTVERHKTITLTYSRPTDFLFFPGPTVTLTRSKRVYLAS